MIFFDTDNGKFPPLFKKSHKWKNGRRKLFFGFKVFLMERQKIFLLTLFFCCVFPSVTTRQNQPEGSFYLNQFLLNTDNKSLSIDFNFHLHLHQVANFPPRFFFLKCFMLSSSCFLCELLLFNAHV